LKKLVKLTVLSPVHIGDERGKRTQLEFFEEYAFIHIFSEDKLIRALKQKGKISAFLNYLEQQPYPSLKRFWQHIHPKDRNFILKEATVRKIRKGAFNIKSLQPHISDPITSIPYIPGSSIKGSLRSALLYYFVSENTNPFIKVFEKLIKERNLKNRKEIGTELDVYYFQSNNIKGKNRLKKGGNTDLMRLVKVSDAFVRKEYRSNQISEVVRVKIVSLNNNGGFHFSKSRDSDIEVFVEVIKPGTELIFEIDIDEFLKEFIETNGHRKKEYQYDQGDMEELLRKALITKYEKLLIEEKDFFEKCGLYSEENNSYMKKSFDTLIKKGVNFRIGWGTGLLNMTPNLFLGKDKRQELRSNFFQRRSNPVFPQSRKVIVDENDRITDTLGWCKLEFLE